MKVTPGMIGKFEQCKSVEEVMEKAKGENISMTGDDARKVFEMLKSEDLSDEMMEEVSGGRAINRRDYNIYRRERII